MRNRCASAAGRATGALIAASLTVLLSACAATGPAPAPTTPSTSPPVTRSLPEPVYTPPTARELTLRRAAELVSAMSVTEQASLVVMTTVPGTDPVHLTRMLDHSGSAGFILMGNNIPADPGALRTLTDALRGDPALPRLIAIDQEGGVVSRLDSDQFPAADTLQHEPAANTALAFSERASLLRAAGINVNFGIVADVGHDPASFIFSRTLGQDPQSAADRVTAAVSAEQSAGIASTLKHFPGHGAVTEDSHFTLPEAGTGKQEWSEGDRLPFQAGIDQGARLVMFGHLVFPQIDGAPASLSPEWHRIAREELGFEGVIVTDDLGMLQSSGIAEFADPARNVVRAIAAGADLALVIAHSTPETTAASAAAISAAVADGSLSADRLREAALRVTVLRLRLAEDE